MFAPTPLLTVTVEAVGNGTSDVHVHAGGQGFWIARMVRQLGVRVTMCCTPGGEVGPVVKQLVEAADVEVRGVTTAVSNGVYIHDRRSGSRSVVAQSDPAPLTRHETDELYGAVLGEALDAQVCVIAGPGSDGVVADDLYGRLAADLRAAETPTVADLSGERLASVLTGGVTVLKVSDEELVRDGMLDENAGETAPLEAVRQLAGAGAAGGLNVTRHGLATGTRQDIERLVRRVELRPVEIDRCTS